MLTQEYLKTILEYNPDTGNFIWIKTLSNRIKTGSVAGCVKDKKYPCILIRIKNKLYRAHRLVWLYIYGFMPNHEIDHINHNPSDNRLINLREVNRLDQMKNTGVRCDSISGITGVRWNGFSYVATINIDGKKINLGSYSLIEEASAARDAANIIYGFHQNHGKE